jgi:adenosine kinase
MQIFVSGSLAYDRIMDFPGRFADHLLPDKLHILNVCFMVGGLKEKFGGTAGNIAYNLALLGETPLILAAAGQDFERYEAWLKKNGLPLDGIRRVDDVLTAGAYITTDKADNQITAFNPGAMDRRSRYRFDGLDPQTTLAIISPGNLNDMREYSQTYKDLKTPYIFDPGQSIPAFSGQDLAEMISGSEIFISNDYELEMIRQSTGLSNGDLLKKTKNIITTLGEAGSVIVNSTGQTRVPARKVSRVVDPTGAGDAYRAGLIKGLAMGRSLPEAASMGATCAAYAVEHLGTQEHSFTQEEFWTRHQAD